MNKLILLRKGNFIVKILGQFRTKKRAKWFIEDNFPEFYKDIYQWSKFQSDEFITIE